MKEYKTSNAIVRVHGSAERARVEQATVAFLKAVEKQRKEKNK